MPACTKDDCDNNQKRAASINVTRHSAGSALIAYGEVSVTIVSIDPNPADPSDSLTMTFNASGDNITSGNITFTTAGDDNKKYRYTIPKRTVWLACPSTALAPDENGGLYISTEGLTLAAANANVRPIYGSPGSLNDGAILIKWPDPGPDVELPTPVPIWPTSIIVKGFAYDDPEFSGDVDLLDATAAGLHQLIQLDHGVSITVNLSGIGRGQFGLGELAEKTGERELMQALELVATPYNNDDDARARAWRLIAQWRRYLKWSERTGHNSDGKRKFERRIKDALSALHKSR